MNIVVQNVVPFPNGHLARQQMHDAATRQLNLTTEDWSHVQECRPCLETFVEVIRQQTRDAVAAARINQRDQSVNKREFWFC